MELTEIDKLELPEFADELLNFLKENVHNSFEVVVNPVGILFNLIVKTFECHYKGRVVRIHVYKSKNIFIYFEKEHTEARYKVSIEDLASDGISLTTFETNFDDLINFLFSGEVNVMNYDLVEGTIEDWNAANAKLN